MNIGNNEQAFVFDSNTGKVITTLTSLKTSGIEKSGTSEYTSKSNDNTIRSHVIKFLLENKKAFDMHIDYSSPLDNKEKIDIAKYQLENELYGIAHTLEIRDGKAVVHISELVE